MRMTRFATRSALAMLLAALVAATPARAAGGMADLVITALGTIGVNYRYGGETPENGLDCSGLVRYVFRQVAGVALPRTSKELATLGAPVKRADLEPGDLVFFNTRGPANSHVGIFLGDGRFIQAPSRGGSVGIAELDNGYWRRHYNGARRLAGVLPGLARDSGNTALAANGQP